MSQHATILIPLTLLTALVVGCTSGTPGTASGSNAAAQPQASTAPAAVPGATPQAGGKFSDAQVETMLACASASTKPNAKSVVTMLQQYKVANAMQRSLAEPTIETYAKEIGCL